MNKERLKFWVTCPSCGQKFGVISETVLKYVDRLFNELGKKIEKKARQAQK